VCVCVWRVQLIAYETTIGRTIFSTRMTIKVIYMVEEKYTPSHIYCGLMMQKMHNLNHSVTRH